MSDVLTVMVVDDSPAVRAVLGVILHAGGYDVMFAEHVDVALDLFGLRRPDVVLTDYTMPDKTGRELVLRLRDEGFENPIFVLSSEHDPEIRAAMARAGADRWMSKPVCAATLLNALESTRRLDAQPSRALPPASSARAARPA